MTRFRTFLAFLALAAGGAAVLGPEAAWTAPSTPTTLTYELTGCTGPAGTPAEFEAVKQPGGAAALQLTDGSATFVLVEAVDPDGAVLFTTPGFRHNDLPTVECDLVHPETGAEMRVTGLMAPVR